MDSQSGRKAENALAINIADADNIVAVQNQGFTTTPSLPTSDDGSELDDSKSQG